MTAPPWTALLWLDWHLLVNRARTIARNPRRMVPWLIFLVWLVPSFTTRILLGRHLPKSPEFTPLAAAIGQLGILVPGLALFAVGLATWRAASSPPAAFQSPADARFVIGAGLDSRAVFTWLSLRTVQRLILTFVVTLVVLQVLYLPWLGLDFTNAITFTVALATFGGVVFGARLLAFTLQRAAPAVPVGALGLLAAVVGVAVSVGALAQLTGSVRLPAFFVSADYALPPGSWMLDAFRGQWLGELELAAAAVALTAAGIALAGDCYPELWATSSRAIAMRRAMRSRSGGAFGYLSSRSRDGGASGRVAERHVQSSSGVLVPAGPLMVLWKEWLTVKRARGGLLLQGGLIAAAVVLGLIIGQALAEGSRLAGLVGAMVGLLAIFWSWAAGAQLARDLGSPLWWLSSAALWSRLVVWTFARGLRFAIPLVVFAECAILGSGSYLWALPIAPIGPILLCWMSQAVGLGVYALLPARTDSRLAMSLRMFAIYGVTVPLALSVIPGLLLHSPVLVLSLPVSVISGVIIGMIAFASWRIQGNGLAFAREERQ